MYMQWFLVRGIVQDTKLWMVKAFDLAMKGSNCYIWRIDAPVSLVVYYKITALCLCLFICRFHSSVYGRLDTLWLYRVSLCYRLVFWRSWHICNHSLHNLLPNSSSYYAYIIQCHLKGQYNVVFMIGEVRWWPWEAKCWLCDGKTSLVYACSRRDHYMWQKHHRYTCTYACFT